MEKLHCDPQVLKQLQKDDVEVQVVTYKQKKGSTKPQDRETIVTPTKIQDCHVTGCVVNKGAYSVTTIDGRHYRGVVKVDKNSV